MERIEYTTETLARLTQENTRLRAQQNALNALLAAASRVLLCSPDLYAKGAEGWDREWELKRAQDALREAVLLAT